MKPAMILGLLALAMTPAASRAEPADPTIGLFAQDAALANDFEVAEAKIVVEDSTNPTLKAFAEQMMLDHAMAQRELREAGRAAGVVTAFVLDSARQQKVDALGLMDGSKLDQAYLADQVEAHAGAAASLQGYAASGSDPALVAYARRTLPTVLEHQHMLERITGRPQPL